MTTALLMTVMGSLLADAEKRTKHRSWCCKRYILAKKLTALPRRFYRKYGGAIREPIELEAALDKCWDIL